MISIFVLKQFFFHAGNVHVYYSNDAIIIKSECYLLEKRNV